MRNRGKGGGVENEGVMIGYMKGALDEYHGLLWVVMLWCVFNIQIHTNRVGQGLLWVVVWCCTWGSRSPLESKVLAFRSTLTG